MDLEAIKTMIEGIGTGLKKDEDWMPGIILENAIGPEGKRGNIMMILVDFFSEEKGSKGKDEAATVMTLLISKLEPDAACFISTAWMAPTLVEDYKSDSYVLPSKAPNRKEIVMCVCRARKGEHDGETVFYGLIDRSGDHPKIKQWTTMSEDGEESGGRFADALRMGFNLIGEPNGD